MGNCSSNKFKGQPKLIPFSVVEYKMGGPQPALKSVISSNITAASSQPEPITNPKRPSSGIKPATHTIRVSKVMQPTSPRYATRSHIPNPPATHPSRHFLDFKTQTTISSGSYVNKRVLNLQPSVNTTTNLL